MTSLTAPAVPAALAPTEGASVELIDVVKD
ncbi:hypothetical protein BH10ACT3_BH10ACT3_19460 [soil metagenome]